MRDSVPGQGLRPADQTPGQARLYRAARQLHRRGARLARTAGCSAAAWWRRTPSRSRRRWAPARGSAAAARRDAEGPPPAQAQGPHRRAALTLLQESARERAAEPGGQADQKGRAQRVKRRDHLSLLSATRNEADGSFLEKP